jgi:ectoine hydroxylase-related dioxygenase (phytanoyl-CoA dioxygenase family)
MTAQLTRLSVDSPDIVSVLEEEGAVMVEGMLSDDLLRRFNDELDVQLADAPTKMPFFNEFIDHFYGDKTKRIGALPAKCPAFSELLTHPVLLAACDQILLRACSSYQMNIGQVIDVGPGSTEQMLHRDEDVWVHVPRPAPMFQVASMTALVDFTAEIGATRIVPGSHRWERERAPEDDEIAVAAMPAGSTVIYLGRTLHGAGANTTSDSWRRGLHLSYLVGWLRTEENNYLGVPPEKARTLPRRAQELLGYAVHDAIDAAGGICGHVDMRDPMEMLKE